MEAGAVVLDLDQLRRSCASCALRELCLPAGVGDTDLQRLDAVVRDKRLLERGKTLYRQGDSFHALYVVRTGSLKTYVENPAGDVQVLGFHLPGEIVGMDAMADNRHLCGAEALERASICELPHAQLQRLVSEIPKLHQQLVRVVSREVAADHGHLVIMGRQHAQERLAIFLRGFAERYERLSRDPLRLSLPMSRHDLASYLGLAMETVSRLFGRMEAEGVLAVERKKVHILRPALLAGLCGDDRPMHFGSEAS
ncbi:MAG: cyclic nucleotide-binding domain-containing protein [Rhodanobacteraceae bacterium]